jgi:hypothetical protein
MMLDAIIRIHSLEIRRGNPSFEFLNEETLGWGAEEGGCESSTYCAVEVDASPDEEGGWEGEENERCGDEAECGLGYEPRGDVVVDFGRFWFGGPRVEEEWAEVTTAI